MRQNLLTPLLSSTGSAFLKWNGSYATKLRDRQTHAAPQGAITQDIFEMQEGNATWVQDTDTHLPHTHKAKQMGTFTNTKDGSQRPPAPSSGS